MTPPLQTATQHMKTALTQDGVTIKDVLECKDDLIGIIDALSSMTGIITTAACNSGTHKKRRIKSKLVYSPLNADQEPDAKFKAWCDTGAILCRLRGQDDIFTRNARQIVGASYRDGKSVMSVVSHARRYPNAYSLTGNKGSYYQYTR